MCADSTFSCWHLAAFCPGPAQHSERAAHLRLNLSVSSMYCIQSAPYHCACWAKHTALFTCSMGNLLLWCTLPEQEIGKTSASLTGLGVFGFGQELDNLQLSDPLDLSCDRYLMNARIGLHSQQRVACPHLWQVTHPWPPDNCLLLTEGSFMFLSSSSAWIKICSTSTYICRLRPPKSFSKICLGRSCLNTSL